MSFELETLTDVVNLLKTKEARDNGIEEKVFHRNGIVSIEVAATELRHRGYEVETFDAGGGSTDTSARRPTCGGSAAQERPARALHRPRPQTEPRSLRRSRLTCP